MKEIIRECKIFDNFIVIYFKTAFFKTLMFKEI